MPQVGRRAGHAEFEGDVGLHSKHPLDAWRAHDEVVSDEC